MYFAKNRTYPCPIIGLFIGNTIREYTVQALNVGIIQLSSKITKKSHFQKCMRDPYINPQQKPAIYRTKKPVDFHPKTKHTKNMENKTNCLFCSDSSCTHCLRGKAAAQRMASLQDRLNQAAIKAGQPSGYVLSRHLHQDSYRDRTGYKVQGPDEQRALQWVAAATKGRITVSRVPWSIPGTPGTTWVTTNYVETNSTHIGE